MKRYKEVSLQEALETRIKDRTKEKLFKLAKKINNDEKIIVKIRHGGKFDGCHCYIIEHNEVVSYYHDWNCECNFKKLLTKYDV